MIPSESWSQFLRVMLRIAAHSFGGPVAQIGFVHEELVERRRWIEEPTFGRLLGFCNLLPGPEALELVIHVGYIRRGIAGGIVAGLLFITPGVISLTLLAWIYQTFGSVENLTYIQAAVRAVAVALVVAAALRLARKFLKTASSVVIAGVTLLLSVMISIPFALVLLSGAVAGMLLRREKPLSAGLLTPLATTLVVIAVVTGLAAPTKRAVQPAAQQERALRRGDAATGEIALLNLRTALVTFGGAYTALPYLRQEAVERLGWVTEGEMLDAVALGETTPGPLISIAVFLSYLAGGLHGAMVGAFFLFLPSFVLVLSLARFMDRITKNPLLMRGLDGLTAATLGLILALVVDLAGGIRAPLPAVIAVSAFLLLTSLRVSPASLVLVAACGAVLAGRLL